MTDRGRRAKVNIDYNIFHKTGEKVLKIEKMEGSDLNEKKIVELQISEDILEIFNIYNINELDSVDELSESIQLITDLAKKYRHIHVDLKHSMGNVDHGNTFQQFGTFSERIRNFIKESKAKLKRLTKEEKEKEEEGMKWQRMKRKEDYSRRKKRKKRN